jgi:hypothetical protein
LEKFTTHYMSFENTDSFDEKYVFKKYLKKNLLESKECIDERIRLINHFDKSIPGLLNTTIDKKRHRYFYRQKYCKPVKKNIYVKDDFSGLVKTLTYFEEKEFVHGDLNRKNIFWTKEGFKVVDYEPCLYQMKDGKKQFMITKPYISKNDITNGKITSLTDKIAFYYFILRMCGYLSNRKVVELSNTLDHQKEIGISENELKYITFESILSIAFQKFK